MPFCFMFPGQSSWRSGMLARIAEASPEGASVLDRAESVLGRDLLALDALARPTSNRDVQIAVVVASLMTLAALDAAGIRADSSLGLSLGEYVHLAHIGAIGTDELLRLVDFRGRAYDEGPPGKMVAVFPLPEEDLRLVLAAHGAGVVEIANLNSPTQHVVGGPHADVDRVVKVLERDHFVELKTIESRIPMHTSTFEPVAKIFRARVEHVSFATPTLAYRPNVESSVLHEPTAADFVRCLSAHVCRPVYWRTSIERVCAEDPSVVFVEVGPGRVLTNLLQRKWIAHRRHAIGDDIRSGIASIEREREREDG